jgi:hypothetical protein
MFNMRRASDWCVSLVDVSYAALYLAVLLSRAFCRSLRTFAAS